MAFPSAARPGASTTADAPARWRPETVALVGLCFAINMADGADVTILSFIAPRLQSQWALGPGAMGQLFSAGLIGMAVGGMLIAPLADRIGRRVVILIALALMSLGMVLSGLARGWGDLFVVRMVVGAGIGTVLAAMAALAAEVAPPHHRGFAVGLVQAGYPFAAVFTGLAAAALLPHHGWRVLLMAAGALTVLLFPAACVLLPRGPGAGERRSGGRVSMLFARELRRRTLALWLAVFAGLMVLYFVVSWIPRLAIAAGLSETNGIYAGALYNFGAFAGTVLLSVSATRLPLGKVVPAMMVGAAVALLVFGSVHFSIRVTLALAFAIGVLLQGGYNGVWPLAAASYPEDIRATGVGWAIGVGRGGAVIGPWLGGVMIAAHVSLPALFGAYCVPLLLCAVAAWLTEKNTNELVTPN